MDRALEARIGILGVLTIVTYGSWYYGFGVLLDSLRSGLHTSDRVLTLGFGLAELLTGLIGIGAGRLLDRRGVRIVFAAGAMTGTGLLTLSSLAHNPWSFSLLFGGAGGIIGATGFYAMTQSIAARLAPGREAPSIARLTVWGAFSSPIFIPGTALANRWWGWRTTLRIDAALVFLAFAIAAAVVDRAGTTSSRRPSVSPVAAVRLAFALPIVRRLAASACAAAAGMAILLVYQVPLLVAAGIGATTASTLAGARGFAQLLGRLPLTRIIDRYDVRPSLRVARAMLAIGCLLVIVSGHTVLSARSWALSPC
jgi:MFS family permease